jgi:hypothetical protein
MTKSTSYPSNETAWYDYDLTDERSVDRLIKKVEKIVRLTFEYDVWQKRTKILKSECPVCKLHFIYVKPESHHHPATLYDITQMVVSQRIAEGTMLEATGLEIVQDIIDLHSLNKVNYIVICKQCHEKYHSGEPETVRRLNEEYEKMVSQPQGEPE